MAPSTIEGLPLLDETTAERYNLSLRLHPDGITYTLSLAQEPAKVLGSDRVFFVPTDEGVEYTDRLSDLIYAYIFLPLPYHHIQIAFDASAFVLVPPGIPVREDEEAWLSIAVPILHDEVGYTASYHLGTEAPTLLAAWERPTFTFLRRTYPYAEILPYVVPTLRDGLIASRSTENVRLIYLLVSPLTLNILVFERGSIKFANRFALIATGTPSSIAGEILYYLGAVWQQIGRDRAADDAIHLFHTTSLEMAQELGNALSSHLSPLGFSLQSIQCSPLSLN